jgi:hypothetical protein
LTIIFTSFIIAVNEGDKERMNPRIEYPETGRLNTEIKALTEDLRRVKTESVRRQIQNQIALKQFAITLRTQPRMYGTPTRVLQPEPLREKVKLILKSKRKKTTKVIKTKRR